MAGHLVLFGYQIGNPALSSVTILDDEKTTCFHSDEILFSFFLLFSCIWPSQDEELDSGANSARFGRSSEGGGTPRAPPPRPLRCSFARSIINSTRSRITQLPCISIIDGLPLTPESLVGLGLLPLADVTRCCGKS
jgi:hypothetical protein